MSYLAIAGGLLTLVYVVRYVLISSSIRENLPIAPKDEASWWLGHEYLVTSNVLGSQYNRWTKMLGPIYRIKAALWQKDIVIVTDHAAVKHIFSDPDNYVKSRAFRNLILKLGGRGMVWAEGEDHKLQRRLTLPAFSISAIRNMAPTVMTCTERMVARINRDLKGNSGVLNICQYIPPFTLDVIGQVGFGVDFGPDTEEGKAILSAYHQDIAGFSLFSTFLVLSLGAAFPWILALGADQETTLKKIIYDAGRRMLAEGPNSDRTDIFSILMRERNRNGGEGARMSEQVLLDNILSFFLAGFDSSSGTIQLILYDIARDSRVQAKLREELLSANLTDFESIDALPYLDAVTREGLRLNPAGVNGQRVALKDDIMPLKEPVTLKNGKTTTSLPVKAGDNFVVSYYTMNTEPSVWGPDSYEFKPERWLKDGKLPSASELPSGPYSSLINFIDGPRVCIGWRLALQEIKILIALMVRSFEFKDAGVTVEKYHSPVVQPFVNGKAAQLPVHVTPIHN